MSDKFKDYLGDLPLTKVIKDRVDEVIKLNTKIKSGDFLDIFICELKDDEGERTYTSLWLFTDKHLIECKEFLSSINFDVTPYVGIINYCSIESTEYNLDEVSEKSSVKIHFTMETKISGNLIATEKNCVHAFKIYQKYILANLKE